MKLFDIIKKEKVDSSEAMEIYNKFQDKLYYQRIRKGEEGSLFNDPNITYKSLLLTERYFQLHKKSK